jgi:two-component system OmpR family response regulator
MSAPRDILLVEDDPAIADLLRRVLVRAGYTVRVAIDGREALEELGEDIPAVLILDIILPGVSGFTILEYIHQRQIILPIIVITANPLHRDSLQNAGIIHVLIKPFRLEELLNALHAPFGFSATV